MKIVLVDLSLFNQIDNSLGQILFKHENCMTIYVT